MHEDFGHIMADSTGKSRAYLLQVISTPLRGVLRSEVVASEAVMSPAGTGSNAMA
jgi:hypothetical protein